MADTILGTSRGDKAFLGSGSQNYDGGAGRDRIISFGDAGEPDPAQSGPEDRVTPPIPLSDTIDIIAGGSGGDRFEFRALLNAKESVLAQHTREDGSVNWKKVAGENDDVHGHWVQGWGKDIILDYNEEEGDCIVIRGHTVEVAEITYGEDERGTYSEIRVISQQGDGGAGGANTETGAHDEDELGCIRVYGDKVTIDDIEVQAAGVFDGVDMLERVDEVYGDHDAGSTQEVFSNTDGHSYTGILASQVDRIHVGLGSQKVNAGGGNDIIYAYSDGGEPDPAQTDGATGRVNPPVPADLADGEYYGGQGRDIFAFRLLLDAKQEILDKHTRDDGTINWRKVAGENGDVHNHWVNGIGKDIIRDFSKQDGDKIDIRGHTVEIAEIKYGEDADGDYSEIVLRSQQGDNGGAHDEDPLGCIKVYGDKVTLDDIKLKANVFYGVDLIEKISAGEAEAPANNSAPAISQIQYAAENPENIDLTFTGTGRSDKIRAGSGKQTVDAGNGNDHIISYADDGEPDPAQLGGNGVGRITPAVPDGAADDVFIGGNGRDTFEFRALINARKDVIEAHTNLSGRVNWGKVAGENDDPHGHWVEGFGNDCILDYFKDQGDRIIIRGHTVQVKEITYGTDAKGDFSMIRVISQQGDGANGGANTLTGAHDEDELGTIKVYGDEVLEDDLILKPTVVDGIDRLEQADKLAKYNGGVTEIHSTTHGETIEMPDLKTNDLITAGAGAQIIKAGGGRDKITLYSDAGEPDPAQTDGDEGRIDPPIDPEQAIDEVWGGQDRDQFLINFLIDATDEVIARHTRDDGSVNWRRVAGENDDVHDHWVAGVGKEIIWDYSNQDGDQIYLRGHTVEIAEIKYGVDEHGDYSEIILRSQQGDGANGGANTAAGAHDEDPLGCIRVYGDKVTEDDIKLRTNVFDGIDKYADESASVAAGNLIVGTNAAETLDGTDEADNMHGRSGKDDMSGNGGNDFMFGEGGNDIMRGGEGDDFLEGGSSRDSMFGDAGNDILVADRGFDFLTGGADADQFVFETASRGGVINDWEDGLDKINFIRNASVNEYGDLNVNVISGDEVMLSYVNDDGRLVGIRLLSDNNFTVDDTDFLF